MQFSTIFCLSKNQISAQKPCIYCTSFLYKQSINHSGQVYFQNFRTRNIPIWTQTLGKLPKNAVLTTKSLGGFLSINLIFRSKKILKNYIFENSQFQAQISPFLVPEFCKYTNPLTIYVIRGFISINLILRSRKQWKLHFW